MKKLFAFLLFTGILSFIPSSLHPFIPSSLHHFFSSSLLAQIPSNGLVAWYPFNGNANDESGNGNNGTVNGATLTSDRFGNVNGAYSFNSNYIEAPLQANFQNFTLSLWIKTSLSIRQIPIIRLNWSDAGQEQFGLALSDLIANNVELVVKSDNPNCTPGLGWNHLNSSVNFYDNQFHHIVATCFDNQLKLYFDSQLVGENIMSNTLSDCNSGSLQIGRNWIGDPAYFYGDIDDILLYNREISNTEIQQLYQDQSGQLQQNTTCLPDYVPTNGLVGYWPFCGNANDESGNGNDLTNNGGVLVADRNNEVQKAYSFSNGYAGLTSSVFNTPSFSYSAWVNPSVLSNGLGDIGGTYFDWQGYFVGVQNGVPHVRIHSTSTTLIKEVFSSQSISANAWALITATFDGSMLKIYVNGVNTGSLDVGNYQFQNRGAIAVGRSPWVLNDGGASFPGKVDDVAVYSRALTATEIQQMYQGQLIQNLTCNITAPTTTLCAGESVNLSIGTTGGAGSTAQLPANLQQGLVAYYPFNGNANDESGNGNNGTVSGATLTSDRFGNATSAYGFDGVSSKISFNSEFVFHQNSDASVSFWMRGEEILSGVYSSIFWSRLSNGDFNRYNLYMYPMANNTMNAVLDYRTPINNGNLNLHILNDYNPISYNQWNLISFVREGSNYSLFLNGALVQTSSDVNTNLPIEQGWMLGINPNGNHFFKGSLDDFMMHNRALSPSEIQQLYTAQSYAWNTGATTNSITVTPTTNTTYSCTVTQGNSTCTASIDITVNPSVTNDISATIIEGESYTLGTQTLTTAGTYTEVFTSAAGCDSTVTLTLAVEPLLTCNITAPTTTLCAGESVDLSISSTGGAGSSSQLPANLQQGLVAYYPFNGNANDESGNGNNGTVNGATLTADRFGNVSSAYSFDGASNYIEIQELSLNLGVDYSISFWAKPLSFIEGYSTLLELNQNTLCNSNPILGFWWTDQLIYSTCGNINNYVSMGNFSQLQNLWTSFVVVCANGVTSIYKNGNFFSEASIQWPQIITNKLTIGNNGNYNPVHGEGFNGYSDDFGIWNRALTIAEIQQLYTTQSYAWNTGATTNSITVTPTTNTTYSCTVTQGNSTCTASVDITVNPTVTNAISATIIEGESYTLGTQTLTTAGTYTEVFTSAEGCDSTVTLTLAVEPLLTCNITAATTTLCAGESVNLLISSAGGTGSSSQLPANLQQGLVAYYPFNGNANDESGNGNNGSFTGKSCNVCTSNVTAPPTLSLNRFGVLSDAYNFGPSLDFISIPNSSGLQLSNSFSINLWLSPSSFDFSGYTEGIVLSKWGNVGAASYEVTVLNSGVFKLNTHNQGQTTSIISSSQLVLGAWNFISIIFTEGSCNLFINGEPDAISNSMLVPMMVDNTIEIGRNFNQFSNYSNEGYLGLLDDITIYNRNLSISEIQQLYTTQSFAWNTGATTNSITVSPTSNTTYSCSVTSGSQTCTASVDITVSPQQTFYADADGDGYGNPQVVVTNCNQPAGYVTNNTDCNDNDAAVYVASTETCNGLDDNCDGQVDEGLTLGSVNATSVTTALYPTCSGNALKSANLNNGANSLIIDGNGLDLWYSMTAQYNTLRASLSAAFGDNEIRLYQVNNGCFELMETEHEVYTVSTAATGNQVLITDDLLVGQTYYIAVHNISGAMNTSAKMCFNHFVGSTCDHYYSNNTGVYNNVCTSFKAQYKGNATNYIFDILSATQNNANLNITPWSYTTTTANSVVPRLGTIFPVNMSNAAKVYTLRIPVIYAIPDAAGNYTSITANATATCTVTLNAELPIALRGSDRCPNTKTTTSSISVDRTICGAQRYEWEFTQQLPSVQSPITVLGGLNTTVFFLNNVPGMGTGKTYNVRVRPIHANGEVGNWGTAQCLKTGTAGMVMQSENESESGVWGNKYSPEQAVTLYPNPTSTGRFTLMSNASEEEVKQVVIADITGKMVFQSQVVMNGNAVEVEFGDLATGMYLVMVGEERLRLVVE